MISTELKSNEEQKRRKNVKIMETQDHGQIHIVFDGQEVSALYRYLRSTTSIYEVEIPNKSPVPSCPEKFIINYDSFINFILN